MVSYMQVYASLVAQLFYIMPSLDIFCYNCAFIHNLIVSLLEF